MPWSAVSGATRYELTQRDVSRGTGLTTVYSGSGTSTVITLGAPINRVFDYSARACNSVGCSGWVSAQTDLTGSGTPMAEPASAGSSGP